MINTFAGKAPVVSELLQYTERLGQQDFDAFFSNLVTMNTRRKASSLSLEESALFNNINKVFPLKKMERFLFLDQKRREETIEPAEYQALSRLVRQLEQYDAQRLQWIGQLAILRKMPLNDLRTVLFSFEEHPPK